MNIENATETGVNPAPATVDILPKINIKEIKLRMMMCPAVMLAKRRIINAAGLIIKLSNSTGAKINLTGTGMPGAHNVCAQNSLLVLAKI